MKMKIIMVFLYMCIYISAWKMSPVFESTA